jgi:hypothetical protein
MNAEEWQLADLGEVTIIGAPDLSQQFSQVLNMHGIKTNICKVKEMTLLGFNAVYQQIVALSANNN